ncbi:FHA domain-containing protein [Methanofollis aquaemaris]|uniref:FHA domain-containing protein n=1 Tax=Methanofollis aquaemaris TaxID=126734 RepID=A0A8A3S5N2_9EURY|nr:FHA domain-containing protein [Methanofollis aquaemaris]QSZ67041.1 FHA domain-containing protein [Methanofollis aquaemaris]
MTESDRTLLSGADPDFLEELSDYLDVLGNPVRLRILQLVAGGSKDARSLSRAVGTSYENTRKHLDRLLLAGLVTKEAGLSGETATGVHPVWKYALVPGGLERVVQNLALFGNLGIAADTHGVSLRLREMRDQVSSTFFGNVSLLLVVGGPEDGTVFPLEGRRYALGREDPAGAGAGVEAIALSPAYTAVTRVSRPHCRLVAAGEAWQIEDCESTGGTQVNAVPLRRHERRLLEDGDIIDLARGPQGARLLFTVPPSGQKSDHQA